MRIFVYINTNPTQKHITVHYEQSKACPHIMQQILSQNTTTITCSISDVSNNDDKSIIKLGETANSYWLLIHVKCECNKNAIDVIKEKLSEINDTDIDDILEQSGKFKICDICS